MGNLNIAKNDILTLMEKYYDRNHGLLKPSSPQDVEDRGFVLNEHAMKISNYCKKNNVCVIFRDAGKYSLGRIRKGNPCKGHSILSKTVKKKGECWTYMLPKGSGMDISSYAGYVGCGDGTTPPTLLKLYAVSEDLESQCLFDLNLENMTEDELKRIYTGDYDMEDMLKVSGGKLKRILSSTPDEKSMIDGLNHCMMNNTERSYYLKTFKRTSQCPYSLIRHGAQSSFVSYLISYEGTDELSKYYNENEKDCIAFVNKLQKMALKTEKPLCAFDETGKIYILNKIEDIYCFYKSKNILDQIPFYYFLYDLENNQCKEDEEKRIINFAKNVIAKLLEYVANE